MSQKRNDRIPPHLLQPLIGTSHLLPEPLEDGGVALYPQDLVEYTGNPADFDNPRLDLDSVPLDLLGTYWEAILERIRSPSANPQVDSQKYRIDHQAAHQHGLSAVRTGMTDEYREYCKLMEESVFRPPSPAHSHSIQYREASMRQYVLQLEPQHPFTLPPPNLLHPQSAPFNTHQPSIIDQPRYQNNSYDALEIYHWLQQPHNAQSSQSSQSSNGSAFEFSGQSNRHSPQLQQLGQPSNDNASMFNGQTNQQLEQASNNASNHHSPQLQHLGRLSSTAVEFNGQSNTNRHTPTLQHQGLQPQNGRINGQPPRICSPPSPGPSQEHTSDSDSPCVNAHPTLRATPRATPNSATSQTGSAQVLQVGSASTTVRAASDHLFLGSKSDSKAVDENASQPAQTPRDNVGECKSVFKSYANDRSISA